MNMNKYNDILGVVASYYARTGQPVSKYDMYNPDLILNKLGLDQTNAYKELLNDAHTRAVIQSRKSGVASLLWKIVYNEYQTSSNKEYITFLDTVFANLKIDKLIPQMIDVVLYGYSVFEILWQIKGNRIIPVDIKNRPNDWFNFDEQGICYFKKDKGEKEKINENKFLLLQHEASYDNPYGVAILSLCWWPNFFKKNTIKFWAKATERHANDLTVVKLNDTVENTEATQLISNMNQVRELYNIILCNGEGMDVTTNSNINVTPALFESFNNFLNNEISKAILSQTGTTENNNTVGSFAMSKTHFEVRKDVIENDCKIISTAFDQLIKYITLYNYPDEMNRLPYFEFYTEDEITEESINQDIKLYQLGVRFNKKYISNKYDIAEDAFDIVEQDYFNPFAENNNDTNKELIKDIDITKDITKKTADPNKEPATYPTDNFLSAGIKELEKAINNNYKEIYNDILNFDTDDYEELYNFILSKYEKMNTKQLENIISKCIIYSELIGRTSI